LEGGFSENITLLQRRPVNDLALTLAFAYSLREERVTNALNEQAESVSEPPTPSSMLTSLPVLGKNDIATTTITAAPADRDNDKRRTSSQNEVPNDVSTKSRSQPSQNGVGLSRWGRTFFKTSAPNIPVQNHTEDTPKTPPQLPADTINNTEESTPPPTRFSPGAWGASLSAASRKLNKFRLSSPGSPPSDTSPSSSKGAVHLDDRPTIAGRVTAAVRDSFERRQEIMQKVGGWVANTSDPEACLPDTTDGEESAAAVEIRRLEREVEGRKVSAGISPEEYIARIKRRQEEREAREGKGSSPGVAAGIDDPLGVGRF